MIREAGTLPRNAAIASWASSVYGLRIGATAPARADPDQLKSYAMTMIASALPGDTRWTVSPSALSTSS